MDKLVRRVTVVKLNDAATPGTHVVYKDKDSKKGDKRKGAKLTWSRPLEKAARRLLEADIIRGQEMLRLHDESNRQRRDGWIIDGPGILLAAQKRAFNEARKADPLRLLPKAY